MTAILEVDGLVKRYGEKTAVDEVRFSVEQGEIFSLLGPNGAGKSTTIGMLSTLLEPSAGDATIAGHSVRHESTAVRQIIGVVPQEIALYDDLSARENLAFWGRMYGLGGARLRTRIQAVLEQVGLSDRAGDRVKSYSGGMKRRINIAVGLLHEPRVLFMDEPTVGIDPQSRRAILDTVKELNRSGLTVLYTTHYMEEAEELSHRVGIVDHGKLIALGTQNELTRQVGEYDTLRLTLAEGQDSATLAEILRQLALVSAVAADGQHVSLTVASAQEALASAVTQASAAGFVIRSVDIEEPDLEAVFLQLTGRALRD